MGSDKKGAVPLTRSPKQQKAVERRAAEAQEAADLAVQQSEAKAHAAKLAQIVNLHIAGFSLSDIALAVGSTEAEIERTLAQDVARYVRTQPALRTYVRNWVSSKYMSMLDADMDIATKKNHPAKLEHQDRVLRILDKMAKLHGAEAPTQTEVKVDAAPEAVERLVSAIAAGQGLGYDVSIFDGDDIVDAEVVHEGVDASLAALEAASKHVEESDGDDEL